MKRLFVFLVVVASTPAALLLIASLANAHFALADSLSHFRAHYVALLVLSLAAALVLRAKRLTLVMVAAITAGLSSMYPAWPGLSPIISHPQTARPGHVKLIQFNTLFKNPSVDVSAQWLLAQSPDFVVMQEVSSTTITIYDQLARDLPYGAFCKFATVGGVAVRSKHPVTAQFCREKQGFVWVQVNVDGKAVTLASLHLHWPYPYGQWEQLQALNADFRAMPRPVVLAGDFNAAPWSEAVARVADATETTPVPGLRLTLRMGAGGVGPMPFLPIDHILLPTAVDAAAISVGPPIGSDHLPVVAEFTLR
jgi:endonuclease/exonuclease/phosphatase (EEP) superfamily protein YafD